MKRWLSLVALATAASLFAEVKLPPFTRQTDVLCAAWGGESLNDRAHAPA